MKSKNCLNTGITCKNVFPLYSCVKIAGNLISILYFKDFVTQFFRNTHLIVEEMYNMYIE